MNLETKEFPVPETEAIGAVNGKMRVLGHGDLFGKSPQCACCGNGISPYGYIDLGLYFDWEGQIFFCVTCVSQMAETAGMLSKAESDHLTELSKELATENARLKERVAEVNEQLKSYDTVLASRFGGNRSSGINLLDDNSTSGEPAVKPKVGESTTVSANAGTDAESVPSESSKSDGRSDITRPERGNINI
jgi:hypothetical protein